jgi:hypothetical protein
MIRKEIANLITNVLIMSLLQAYLGLRNPKKGAILFSQA